MKSTATIRLQSEDFDAAADDFLDLNFIAYHSAWPYHGELAALKGFQQRGIAGKIVGFPFLPGQEIFDDPLKIMQGMAQPRCFDRSRPVQKPRQGLRAEGFLSVFSGLGPEVSE